MKLPIKYKLYNNRLWVRWGLEDTWKVVRTTTAKTVTPITQVFGANFEWDERRNKNNPHPEWLGRMFYGDIIPGIIGHNGIDFECPTGTRLYAPEDMEIIELTTADGYGVKAKSATGYHRFLHLKEFHCSVGQKLKQGEFFALGNNSGRYTTAAHLHWDFKPINFDVNNGYRGVIDHRSFIEGLDVVQFPYKDGDCLLVKPHGKFYVVEGGDLVFYDSNKQPDKHIPIVDFFIKKNKEGLPPNFIKVINEEELDNYINLIK